MCLVVIYPFQLVNFSYVIWTLATMYYNTHLLPYFYITVCPWYSHYYSTHLHGTNTNLLVLETHQLVHQCQLLWGCRALTMVVGRVLLFLLVLKIKQKLKFIFQIVSSFSWTAQDPLVFESPGPPSPSSSPAVAVFVGVDGCGVAGGADASRCRWACVVFGHVVHAVVVVLPMLVRLGADAGAVRSADDDGLGLPWTSSVAAVAVATPSSSAVVADPAWPNAC